MQFFTTEQPSLGITLPRHAESRQFGHLVRQLISSGNLLQAVAYPLIQALTHGLCLLTRFRGKRPVHRKRDVHRIRPAEATGSRTSFVHVLDLNGRKPVHRPLQMDICCAT